MGWTAVGTPDSRCSSCCPLSSHTAAEHRRPAPRIESQTRGRQAVRERRPPAHHRRYEPPRSDTRNSIRQICALLDRVLYEERRTVGTWHSGDDTSEHHLAVDQLMETTAVLHGVALLRDDFTSLVHKGVTVSPLAVAVRKDKRSLPFGFGTHREHAPRGLVPPKFTDDQRLLSLAGPRNRRQRDGRRRLTAPRVNGTRVVVTAASERSSNHDDTQHPHSPFDVSPAPMVPRSADPSRHDKRRCGQERAWIRSESVRRAPSAAYATRRKASRAGPGNAVCSVSSMR